MIKVLKVDQNRWLSKFQSMGAENFYKLLLRYAITRIAQNETQKELADKVPPIMSDKETRIAAKKLAKQETSNRISPEIELLTYYNHFLHLYRRDKIEDYFEISKAFRRASFKIYRVLLKQNLIVKNNKFFNLVG